jgi:hypothetical protein
MMHSMTEDEYAQYLKEMEELQEYRRLKENLPARIRRYFDNVKWHVENDRTHFVLFTGCAKENGGGTYCDGCPVGSLFGKCPLGYNKEHSK